MERRCKHCGTPMQFMIKQPELEHKHGSWYIHFVAFYQCQTLDCGFCGNIELYRQMAIGANQLQRDHWLSWGLGNEGE
jgi:GH43 family beta-xylosidase